MQYKHLCRCTNYGNSIPSNESEVGDKAKQGRKTASQQFKCFFYFAKISQKNQSSEIKWGQCDYIIVQWGTGNVGRQKNLLFKTKSSIQRV